MKEVTTITKINPSYQHSEELALCLKLFKRAFRESQLHILSDETDIRGFIMDRIRDLPEYILLVKEPAVLVAENTLKELRWVMDNHPHIDCVIPLEVMHYSEEPAAEYYTMRGFQRFTAHHIKRERRIVPYDGREPFMFMIRKNVYMSGHLSGDVFASPKQLDPERVCISMNTFIHPFVNYYEESREEMLEMLPEDINSVIDIGCARGKFGELLKRRKGYRVIGVEKNPIEAEKAKNRLDGVITGDFLEVSIIEKFDCATCLDTLEHVPDTEKFLKKIGEILRPGGYLLLSIPNIGHWSVVEDLLAGRWDYTPAGTLCITHFRFFTKRSIEEFLKETGFEILRIRPIRSELKRDILSVLDLLKGRLEIDEESLSTLCYHILSRKTGRQDET